MGTFGESMFHSYNISINPNIRLKRCIVLFNNLILFIGSYIRYNIKRTANFRRSWYYTNNNGITSALGIEAIA